LLWARKDDAVHVIFLDQMHVPILIFRADGLQQHLITFLAGRFPHSQHDLWQQRIRENLFAALTQDQPQCVRPTAGQFSARGIGMIAQLTGSIQHTLARLGADTDVGNII